MGKIIAIVAVVILIILGVAVGYRYETSKTSVQKGCTQEAKICSDGSSVGRTGPNCEFAQCPVQKDPAAGWNKYNNAKLGFEFKYPTSYVDISNQGFPSLPQNKYFLVKLQNPQDNSSISVMSDLAPFSLDYLKVYAPTGGENFLPTPKLFGKNTFFYYGAGGGGVNYPDQYFISLNGKVLEFIFNGPYDGSSTDPKSPGATAKTMAEQILSTFKTLSPSNQSGNLQTYKNTDLNFSINYPSNWTAAVSNAGSKQQGSVQITNGSASGSVTIYWGGGFGGGPCPGTHQKVQTGAGIIDMCRINLAGGSVNLSRANDAQGETFIDKVSPAFMFIATIKDPQVEQGILDIFKTFNWL